MADPNAFRSPFAEGLLPRTSAQSSPQLASVAPGTLGLSSPLRSTSSTGWNEVGTSARQPQQPLPQHLFYNDPGLSPSSLQQDYNALARQRELEHSPSAQHMTRQEWYEALQREQQQQQEQQHLHQVDQQLASAMEQRLNLAYGDQPLPDAKGQLGSIDPNQPIFQQHQPLPVSGRFSFPGFPGGQPPPGFPASPSHMGRLPGGGGGGGPAGFPGYDPRRTPPSHLEPGLNMQSHSPMFSPAKSPLGPPPGLGGGSGPFMSLDAGSGSVSQQLDAYQERLHAQLQIQQQLLQRQHQLHQMYLFQQQQQQLLGVNPSMMDQHQLPPFFAMAPPGQNSSDTVHPQQYAHPPGFLQGGAPHLMLNRDNGASSLSGSVSQEQQEQAQHIQRHLNDVLFENQNGGGNQQGTATQATAAVAQAEVMGVLPKNHLSLEEIEAAQFMALQAHQHQHQHQQQKPRKSLSDLVLPPEVSSSSERISASTDENAESGDTRVPDQAPVSATPKASTTLNPAEGMGAGPATRAGAKGGGNHRYSHLPDQHHHHQQHHRRKASVTHDTSFSIKDTNLFSVPKYDPYRPSHTVFDTITTEMKSLCEELLPNPAEETRKLGLLDRLQVLANEVFGEADVLPFGSSGNGLALANADMDLCVFLPEQSKKNTIYKRGRNKETDSSSQDQKDAIEEEKEKDEGEKEEEKDKTPEVQQKQSKEGEEDSGEKEEEEEGEEEVSAAEFVERMGNRLEEDPEFRDILQLRKARVPIVKLVHSPTGIACDIGYENHLALWNTRLLRAYSRIDGRLRELVSVIKYWAKQRKLNNPYVGTLSSYAYVLLVIHVLQVWGVLPNLQRITADNSGRIPFWDCQGFNRYFFEDVSALDSHWKPTEESRRQSVGELLYEFFRYFVNEFRYATQVVSIRKGGLLTKEQKEWSKEFLQAENRPQTGARGRYLFCIEDPFEVDHNVARTVDRYTLFAIRGEFMRATKILSRGGDNIIGRLCQEKEESPAPESGGNSGNTQEDAAGATGEGDGDKGEQEDDLASGHTTTKPARPHNLFSEGDEPIRTNNGNNTSAHGGSGHAGRDSHHGGSRRASMTPRDGHHHSNSRLSYQQQARQQQQQQHGSNQSQRDSYKRASLAGGSHGSNPRDRPRQ